MDAYPPVGDAESAAALPELPWHVLTAEDIAEVLEVLASGRPLLMPALADEGES